MPRFRDPITGSTVNVPDEVARSRGFEPLDKGKPDDKAGKPARRQAKKD